jgi:hypothetical protein
MMVGRLYTDLEKLTPAHTPAFLLQYDARKG